MQLISALLFLALLPAPFAWGNPQPAHSFSKPKTTLQEDWSLEEYEYLNPAAKPQHFCTYSVKKYKEYTDLDKVIRLKIKPRLEVNCTITHYSMYTVKQQHRLVNDCFMHHYQGVQFRLPNCTFLLEANEEHDKRYPEFVEMRKQYVKLVAKAKEEDTFLVNFCFSALLQGDWTRENCTQFTKVPVFPANTSKPSNQEVFRLDAFEDLLKSICPNLAKPEAASKLCAVFNQKRVADCFFASVKNSFCKTVQRGPPVGISATLQYYRTLHHMYNGLKRQANWEHGRLLDCIENHRKDKAEKCRGLNWDRREPKTRMEAKTLALYDRLAQLHEPTTTLAPTTTVEPTTMAPTTLAPNTSAPMLDADQKSDLALAHFCLEALLADDWDQDDCAEFQQATSFSANPTVPTEREAFRRNAFDQLLWEKYYSRTEY